VIVAFGLLGYLAGGKIRRQIVVGDAGSPGPAAPLPTT